MDASPNLGHVIAAAARRIHQSQDLEETLRAIAFAARNSIPGFDQVGISTVRKDGLIETRAATGELVHELDRAQYSLREGPCFETLRSAEVVVAPEIRNDPRWPRYVPEAVAKGLRSQLAIKLYLDEAGTLGGLNLYSTTSDQIDPLAEPTAELFAAHAAIALSHARQRQSLNEGLSSRKVIGQALGILMERYQVDEDRAFAFLVRTSSETNTKLRDIAQELVDQGNTPSRAT